jgi:hypothetical protein
MCFATRDPHANIFRSSLVRIRKGQGNRYRQFRMGAPRESSVARSRPVCMARAFTSMLPQRPVIVAEAYPEFDSSLAAEG